MILGENGLIGRASQGAKDYELAGIKEQIQMELLSESIGDTGTIGITDSKLVDILEKYGEVIYEEDGTTPKGVKPEKYPEEEILLSDIWNGTTVAGGESETNKPATLPPQLGGANSPDISGFSVEDTVYVTWGSSSPYVIDETININEQPPAAWSNYTGKEWANIKTTGGDNPCYWVWIPRYAYKVPTKPTVDNTVAETIEVAFLSGTGSSIADVIDPTLKTTIETEGGFLTTPTPGKWVIHPAFTSEGNGGLGNLTGIWVAKFEASSSSQTSNFVNNDTAFTTALADTTNHGGSITDTDLQVNVVPNVVSWRHINVNNIFTVCQNITKPGNSLDGASGIDSHMMKNSEWGAVAYLSRSQYGKNGKVANNNFYHSSSYASITGVTTNSDTSITQTAINTLSKYNSETGVNASTSGNVYGVYDMAGGAWEYVAGYVNNYTANSSTNISNLRLEENAKYSDIYEGRTDTGAVANTTSHNNDSQQYNYGAAITKYGDAVYETSTNHTGSSSWDGDYSYFPYTTYSVFRRGGRACSDSGAGVFAFYYDTGDVHVNNGFRPVLVSPQ